MGATAEVAACADTGVPMLGGAHVPDLSTLDGEAATCARCGARVVGDGPYAVERWDNPDPPNDGITEASTLRWILVKRTSAVRGEGPGYFRNEELARRVAALLNFAHRAEQAP
jgi:hypothetical protein